jgi:dephospho-CoA kinase
MVGLTGGIGAGKSAVAKRLSERGAVIIDADRLAREVVAAGTDGLAEVVAAFGSGVLRADGELDRPALGRQVFGDDDARRRLEAIMHPRVRARTAQLTRAAPGDAIVVNDVPLLAETGLAPTYHLVIVVEAAREIRIRRLVESRRMPREQAVARIKAQADDACRRAVADVVIDNEAGLDDLNAQVDRLWRDRLVPFQANLRNRRAAPSSSALHIAEYDPSWPAQAERLIARIERAIALSDDAGRSGDAHRLGGVGGSHDAGRLGDPGGLRDAGRLGNAGPSLGVTAAPGASHLYRVTHIGSTAVPGLPAKDLIDLMLAVGTLDEADRLAGRLAAAGFPARDGEWADNARGIPGKTWPKRLHGSADPARSVNLHVRVAGSPGWRFALLMRDHLRAVPEALAGYAAAKKEWAARHQDLTGYAEAKEPWFDAEAEAAEAWARATGWHPT